jgi:hypothetical protein
MERKISFNRLGLFCKGVSLLMLICLATYLGNTRQDGLFISIVTIFPSITIALSFIWQLLNTKD